MIYLFFTLRLTFCIDDGCQNKIIAICVNVDGLFSKKLNAFFLCVLLNCVHFKTLVYYDHFQQNI